MSLSLFDHIQEITQRQNPKYFETLGERDIKTFDNYMILRFLSMKYEWVDTLANLQPYLQDLPKKAFYLTLIDVLPKGKQYLKYHKGDKVKRHEKWVVDIFSKYYEVPSVQAQEYLDICMKTKEGITHVKTILEKYGIEKEQIQKLKLKIQPRK